MRLQEISPLLGIEQLHRISSSGLSVQRTAGFFSSREQERRGRLASITRILRIYGVYPVFTGFIVMTI
jgi:hypothetical protein